MCFQIRLHESREFSLEEVTSKDTDRPASEGEARAVMEGDTLLGSGVDGNVEVVVEKDVLDEEFTRSETTHEEKVILVILQCCFQKYAIVAIL